MDNPFETPSSPQVVDRHASSKDTTVEHVEMARPASDETPSRDSDAPGALKDSLASNLEKLSITNAKLDPELLNSITTHPVLHDYLLKNSLEYLDNSILRNQGWASNAADEHFMLLRDKADNVDPNGQKVFYDQMCQIGEDMDKEHNLSLELELASENPKFMDLCMAPGGFSGTILNNTRNSAVCGISLPFSRGGHPLCIDDWENREEIDVQFLDITMLSSEMGLTDIPPDHPDFNQFSTLRPFEVQKFDLVFCDGNVLRIHAREGYREQKERMRLLNSQLVLAFQRMRDGGTLVCRFHKIEGIETVSLLRLFCSISSVSVFKPKRIHGARSSFYMIAKELRVQSPEAISAVERWKKQWTEATLDTEEKERTPMFDNDDPARIALAQDIVENFSAKLIELATPIWAIQADGLRNKPFNRGQKTVFQKYRPRMQGGHVQKTFAPSSHARSALEKSNWRAGSDGHKTQSTESTTPKATLTSIPPRRRGSFIDENLRPPRNHAPKSLWTTSITSSDSRIWGNSWRKPAPSDVNNDSLASEPSPTENEPDATNLDHLPVASHNIFTKAIGRPGGNLIDVTNKSSAASSHGQGGTSPSANSGTAAEAFGSRRPSHTDRRAQDPQFAHEQPGSD